MVFIYIWHKYTHAEAGIYDTCFKFREGIAVDLHINIRPPEETSASKHLLTSCGVSFKIGSVIADQMAFSQHNALTRSSYQMKNATCSYLLAETHFSLICLAPVYGISPTTLSFRENPNLMLTFVVKDTLIDYWELTKGVSVYFWAIKCPISSTNLHGYYLHLLILHTVLSKTKTSWRNIT